MPARLGRRAVLASCSRAGRLAGMVADTRLAMEIAAIQALAERLVAILQQRDPLSERVHLSKAAMLATSAAALYALGRGGGGGGRGGGGGGRGGGGLVAPAVSLAPRAVLDPPSATESAKMTGVTANTPSVAAPPPAAARFYLAMRILPRDQRQAMFEIYSFCRAVDDVADGDAPRAVKHEQLAQWRRHIDALYDGQAVAGLEGLAQAIKQFACARTISSPSSTAMEMDAPKTSARPSLETLDLYCDRSPLPSAACRVRVFGLEEADGIQARAPSRPRAALTNILRDIDEDAGIGRLYLPREALSRAGIAGSDPVAVIAEPNIGAACAVVADHAAGIYAEADAVMAALRAAHRARAAHHERSLCAGCWRDNGHARLDLAGVIVCISAVLT